MYNKLNFSIICSICVLAIASIVFINSNNTENEKTIQTSIDSNFNSTSSLNKLMEGNKKYVDATYNASIIDAKARESLLKNGQKPFAIVLTCSDSRVVPENIFYTGLGDIFVIRVAGNVVDESVIGSIEFGVDSLKIPLILVLGHEDCGAVYNSKSTDIKGSLGKLLNKIAPSYEKAKALGGSESEIIQRATDFNVENSMNIISENKVVKKYINGGVVDVIGGNYSLETGIVRLLN
ncbi:carbonic anhydrase [Romboutsia sp.]|uniref:carbonic anhydrase n=1 Tax=Romboutsia sp. TaxID=1965302 RepID=UPI003F35B50E